MGIGTWTRPVGDLGDVSATVRADYGVQQRREVRESTLVAGIVALVALPIWGLFDRVMVPLQADRFLAVRVAAEIAIALCCAALWWGRTGNRWPEQLSLLTVVVLEVSIAWMVPRAGAELEAYVLGLTLAVYATAFLLVWRWSMTVALAICTTAALGLFSLGASPPLESQQVTVIAFYMATAFALAIAAQVYRERRRWQQHVTQAALEAERSRNALLVGELEQLSREDPLTAAGNRRAWDERLAGELLRARRSGRPLSLVVCDLDHFKVVNDIHGHGVGDAVLRTVTAVLAGRIRQTDFLARLGGDEFAVVCPDTSLAVAGGIATDLREGIRRTSFPDGVAVTCSIGVAELARRDTSTESLYRRADDALYEAKAVRDACRWAEPGGPPVREAVAAPEGASDPRR